MKNIKKMLSAVLALSMAVSMSTYTVFAKAEGEEIPQESIPMGAGFSGERLSIEEQLNMALAQHPSALSDDGDDYRTKAVEKAAVASTMEANIQPFGFSDFSPSSITQKTIAVPYYKQENGHYCGPATLKQTLQYINGSSLSQSKYASKDYLDADTPKSDGTYFTTDTKMLSNVNRLQSRLTYYQNTIDSKNKLLYYVWEDLTTYNAPTILIIKTIDADGTRTDEWSYRTSGHFLSGVGVKAKGTDIRVTDPYIQYVVPAETDGTYWMLSQNVYQAVINHPCEAVQW